MSNVHHLPIEQMLRRAAVSRVEIWFATEQLLLEQVCSWMPEGANTWVCTDGRLAVVEAPQILILPAPAAEIWIEAQARQAIRELSK
jgi:hypothetical protein